MTTSPKTNHAEARVSRDHDVNEARAWANGFSLYDDHALQAFALAQVHATLALEAQTARLADEQRTANLIALALAGIQLGGPGDPTEQWRIIAARLDLTQDVTP